VLVYMLDSVIMLVTQYLLNQTG